MDAQHTTQVGIGPQVVFLDYHGVLTGLDAPALRSPPHIQFLSKAVVQALVSLSTYHLFVVSNQPGVALGDFSEIVLVRAVKQITADLQDLGVRLDGFLYCPHHPSALSSPYRTPCRCRKPSDLLVRQAIDSLGVGNARCLLVGDTLETDIACATNAGIGAVWITQSPDASAEGGVRPCASFGSLFAAVPFIHEFFARGNTDT